MSDLVNLGIDLEAYDDAKSITMNEARRLMRGRKAGGVSIETARRWAGHNGCTPAGRDGPKVVLPTVRVNGELRTMPEWVERFERARTRLGQQTRRQPPALPHRTDRQREAAYRRAEAELDRMGCGTKKTKKPAEG